MSRVSAYRGYLVVEMAIQRSDNLDPAIFDRLIHEGPQSNAEADMIVHLLESVPKNATAPEWSP